MKVVNDDKNKLLRLFPFGVDDEAEALLFCFYHAGGNSEQMRKWKEKSKKIAVVPIEIAGHGSRFREPFSKSILEIAEETAEAIMSVASVRPVYIYGHSFGALNAFETACCLEKKNIPISQLIIAGRGAPFDSDKNGFRLEMGRSALVETLRGLGGMNTELFSDERFAEYFLPIIESDLSLIESYSYDGKTVNCSINAHCGIYDTETDQEQMSHWKTVTLSRLNEKLFDGGHFFIYENEEYFNELIIDILEK